MNSRATIILSHGSRSDDSKQEFQELVQLVKTRPSQKESSLYEAFMSLQEPTLNEAVQKATQDGANDITIVPCFLFKGNHIKIDIPHMIEKLKGQYPSVAFHLTNHVGADARLADIVEDRILSSIRN